MTSLFVDVTLVTLLLVLAACLGGDSDLIESFKDVESQAHSQNFIITIS